jgi:hypothetical protein
MLYNNLLIRRYGSFIGRARKLNIELLDELSALSIKGSIFYEFSNLVRVRTESDIRGSTMPCSSSGSHYQLPVYL